MRHRPDIQWLRAVAICAVLLFHLWPNTFPLGFLGVDVFFVLSGFLMTGILLDPKTVPLGEFYGRRVRRILPAYFWTIFMTLLLCRSLLLAADARILQTDALWSIGIAANLQTLAGRDSYFQLTTEFRFLVHLWSLAVEMQFYLLAPFLVRAVARWPRFVAFVAAASLGSQFLLPLDFGFNLVVCRLWQFLAGSYAFLHTDAHALTLPDGKTSPRRCSTGTALISLVLCFLLASIVRVELPFAVMALRVVATLTTGALLVRADLAATPLPGLAGVLSWLGDISYSVYLCHWPIFVFARYIGHETFDLLAALIILIIVFVVSICQFYLFERQLMQFPKGTVFAVIGCLATAALVLAVLSAADSSQVAELPEELPPSLSREEAIKWNERFGITCGKAMFACKPAPVLDKFLPFEKSGVASAVVGHCGIERSVQGNRTFMILGNSYAMRYSAVMLEALQHSVHSDDFAQGYFVGWSTCPPFPATFNTSTTEHCREKTGVLLPLMERLRPDLLLLVNRLDVVPPLRAPFDPFHPDAIALGMRQDFTELTQHAKQVIVVQPNPPVVAPGTSSNNGASAIVFAQKLSQNVTLQHKVLVQRRQKVDKFLQPPWERMQFAMAASPKVHVVETVQHFCHEAICEMFDRARSLAYFCDGSHVTEHGARLVLRQLLTTLNGLKF